MKTPQPDPRMVDKRLVSRAQRLTKAHPVLARFDRDRDMLPEAFRRRAKAHPCKTFADALELFRLAASAYCERWGRRRVRGSGSRERKHRDAFVAAALLHANQERFTGWQRRGVLPFTSARGPSLAEAAATEFGLSVRTVERAWNRRWFFNYPRGGWRR